MNTKTVELLSGPLFRVLNDKELLLKSSLGERSTPTIDYVPYEAECAGFGITNTVLANDDELVPYHLLTVTDVVDESIVELKKFQSGSPTKMTFNHELQRANIAIVGFGGGHVGIIRIRWSIAGFRIRWFMSKPEFKNEKEKFEWMFQNVRKSSWCAPLKGDVIMLAP